jgi:hypothetical protein
MDSDALTISMAISIIIPETKIIIRLIIRVIIRNDQKFSAQAPKKSEDENLPPSPLRLLKRPPVRKALTKKPIKKTNRKPPEINDIRLLKIGPRSVNAIRLKPTASFSVIMLAPNAEFNEVLRGSATIAIRIRKQSQIIKTPFHDFKERRKPDFIESIIFI